MVHELFKHPLEVGEGIGTVAADLFNEGVNHGTTSVGVFAAVQVCLKCKKSHFFSQKKIDILKTKL
jgi:hypothetical protein